MIILTRNSIKKWHWDTVERYLLDCGVSTDNLADDIVELSKRGISVHELDSDGGLGKRIVPPQVLSFWSLVLVFNDDAQESAFVCRSIIGL